MELALNLLVHCNRAAAAVEWVNNHVALDTEHFVEAKNLLQLYLDGTHGVLLNQMPPYFQQHTIEMLLFNYGESRYFDALCGFFEKQVMAFPLERAHYEVDMD
ncbi:hypothetical protein PsorP6_007739 [Peronosclerospora sorghi]|uniref:Uncharacterized protein n=1 Tax=Peronosclerospora sorghi TaxID=230839 RepID=A0ACC0WBU7_9STRA|nr:hypothetical protein PsorP6_007739 [Peronosclerospora sorghi]